LVESVQRSKLFPTYLNMPQEIRQSHMLGTWDKQ